MGGCCICWRVLSASAKSPWDFKIAGDFKHYILTISYEKVMIIINLIVQKHGVIDHIKSYYSNVASVKQVPDSATEKAEKEYCQVVRKFAGVSEEVWSDEQILDHYGLSYSDDLYDIELAFSDETEQIYPHL